MTDTTTTDTMATTRTGAAGRELGGLEVDGVPVRRMDALELGCLLDCLGIDQVALARVLGVNDRTVRRWSAGDSPVTPFAARIVRALARETDGLVEDFVADGVERLELSEAVGQWRDVASAAGVEDVDGAGRRVAVSWWRVVMGRIASASNVELVDDVTGA